MTVRSQRHKEQVHGSAAPAIIGISPDTASIAAAGAVGRTIATFTTTGGTAPFTYSIAAPGGLSAVISPAICSTPASTPAAPSAPRPSASR